MIDWNKFLGRCGIALLFVSLCAIGFEFHFWVGMIVLAIEIIIIAVVRENEVVPILMKAKKDGTISKLREYIPFGQFTIELVE